MEAASFCLSWKEKHKCLNKVSYSPKARLHGIRNISHPMALSASLLIKSTRRSFERHISGWGQRIRASARGNHLHTAPELAEGLSIAPRRRFCVHTAQILGIFRVILSTCYPGIHPISTDKNHRFCGCIVDFTFYSNGKEAGYQLWHALFIYKYPIQHHDHILEWITCNSRCSSNSSKSRSVCSRLQPISMQYVAMKQSMVLRTVIPMLRKRR